MNKRRLDGLFKALDAAYGPQHWWPANSRMEMLIGAILVQNTAWQNVEKAIANLAAAGWLDAGKIHALPEQQLAEAIRPAGYFNVKARRLKALCAWLHTQGSLNALDAWSTPSLRTALLAVHGVGPETADCILVYAYQRPVFVVDAYTQRLLMRLGWLEQPADYEGLRAVFERTQPQDAEQLGQYHALIVEHAKQQCRARPQCESCVLRPQCQQGNRQQENEQHEC
ncbi:MAG: endonuclease III domain-containing protein [Nevskiales bacterium]